DPAASRGDLPRPRDARHERLRGARPAQGRSADRRHSRGRGDLPRRRRGAAHEALRAGRRHRAEEGSLGRDARAHARGDPARRGAPMTDKPLILNVDDDDAARYVKSRVLRLAGFDVTEAANGEQARAIIAERHPDLVLLDVKLPDVSGRDLCAEIKSDPGTAQIVVIQTSATHADTKNRVASLDAGADGYLVIPIEPEELVAHVRALLRMRKAE